MQQLLKQLKINADVIGKDTNDSIVKYYLKLHPGEKINSIENNIREIALGIKSFGFPIVRLIPEKGIISLEVLTKEQKTINFSDMKELLLNSDLNLPVILGKTYDGKNIIADITKMPHLLVAGTTGSGKSVLLHSIICSLILGTNTKLALIDPKYVEFLCYKDIKDLIYPIANYSNEAQSILSDLVCEMDSRFRLMSKLYVKDISEYNKIKSKKPLPYIVLIIDEFSDLMQTSKKEFQDELCRLAQKSRACGIHIIIATQRPSADVITGIIKANFPARVSCKVTSAINSRVILDQKGAEKLLGNGDAIIDSPVYNMLRFKGAYLNTKDIQDVCNENKRNLFYRFINYMRK
jgi:S-DNA-T family DNA segregation ATPase FtsK/SpoIIIE